MTKQIKGVLGTKLGMTQVFADDGKMVPVTVSTIFRAELSMTSWS